MLAFRTIVLAAINLRPGIRLYRSDSAYIRDVFGLSHAAAFLLTAMPGRADECIGPTSAALAQRRKRNRIILSTLGLPFDGVAFPVIWGALSVVGRYWCALPVLS